MQQPGKLRAGHSRPATEGSMTPPGRRGHTPFLTERAGCMFESNTHTPHKTLKLRKQRGARRNEVKPPRGEKEAVGRRRVLMAFDADLGHTWGSLLGRREELTSRSGRGADRPHTSAHFAKTCCASHWCYWGGSCGWKVLRRCRDGQRAVPRARTHARARGS